MQNLHDPIKNINKICVAGNQDSQPGLSLGNFFGRDNSGTIFYPLADRCGFLLKFEIRWNLLHVRRSQTLLVLRSPPMRVKATWQAKIDPPSVLA